MSLSIFDIQPGEGSVRANWPYINDVRMDHRYRASVLQGGRELISHQRRRPTLGREGNFPFRIYTPMDYQMPDCPDDTLYYFMVRSGRVLGTPLFGNGATSANPNAGTGCDGYDADPYDDYYPASWGEPAPGLAPAAATGGGGIPTVQAFTVPAGENCYPVWIDNTNSNPKLSYPQLMLGNNPSWTGYPLSDGQHWLIALINTAITPGNAVIRQLIDGDIYAAGGGGSAQKLTVSAIATNWVACKPGPVNVALPYHLRASTWQAVGYPGGPYTTTNNPIGQRTGPTGLIQAIYRPYTVGDVIDVISIASGTGLVDGSGKAITLQDMNTDARTYRSQMNACIQGNTVLSWVGLDPVVFTT